MAIKRIVVTICDICEQEVDVTKVEIHLAAARRKIDLCKNCIEPVEKVFSAGQRPQTRKRRKATDSPSRRVTSIEEIEALKATKSA